MVWFHGISEVDSGYKVTWEGLLCAYVDQPHPQIGVGWFWGL